MLLDEIRNAHERGVRLPESGRASGGKPND